ncbi:hypothetical protein PR048_001329 [Dryococelus australis]|uniref:CUB domain-containing protein n=1 Tax=Dryococelus australis TaxID=614101 RepID=A0ABQ9IJG0_9NEOP|nr:hypothetical protein PR048_001329 [Dryococelus australis]
MPGARVKALGVRQKPGRTGSKGKVKTSTRHTSPLKAAAMSCLWPPHCFILCFSPTNGNTFFSTTAGLLRTPCGSEYGAAPECKGGGNGRSPRKLADQRHRDTIPTCENSGGDPDANRTRFAFVGRDEWTVSTTRNKAAEAAGHGALLLSSPHLSLPWHAVTPPPGDSQQSPKSEHLDVATPNSLIAGGFGTSLVCDWLPLVANVSLSAELPVGKLPGPSLIGKLRSDLQLEFATYAAVSPLYMYLLLCGEAEPLLGDRLSSVCSALRFCKAGGATTRRCFQGQPVFCRAHAVAGPWAAITRLRDYQTLLKRKLLLIYNPFPACRLLLTQGPWWLSGWVARLPPRLTGLDPRPGHSRIFVRGNRAGRCHSSVSFLVYLPFLPPFLSGAALYSPRFTLISSQDLDVQDHPNRSTDYITVQTCGEAGLVEFTHRQSGYRNHDPAFITCFCRDAEFTFELTAHFGQRFCRPYSDRVHVTSFDAEFRTCPCPQERPNCTTHAPGRATVAERLACSPPTKAFRVQSAAGSLPDFRKWKSCRTMPLVGGFSRGSPVPPPLSLPAPLHNSIALIGSQDLAVKSHLNFFNHSITRYPAHYACSFEGEFHFKVCARAPGRQQRFGEITQGDLFPFARATSLAGGGGGRQLQGFSEGRKWFVEPSFPGPVRVQASCVPAASNAARSELATSPREKLYVELFWSPAEAILPGNSSASCIQGLTESRNGAEPEWGGGGPRGNPPISGIVRHESHMLKSGDSAGDWTRIALVEGERANRSDTPPPPSLSWRKCSVYLEQPVNTSLKISCDGDEGREKQESERERGRKGVGDKRGIKETGRTMRKLQKDYDKTPRDRTGEREWHEGMPEHEKKEEKCKSMKKLEGMMKQEVKREISRGKKGNPRWPQLARKGAEDETATGFSVGGNCSIQRKMTAKATSAPFPMCKSRMLPRRE